MSLFDQSPFAANAIANAGLMADAAANAASEVLDTCAPIGRTYSQALYQERVGGR